MKNKEEELLNNLFSDARQQPSNLSFDEISNQFTQSVNANVSTQLTKKWYSKLFNLNTIIIMLSTLLVSGIVLFSVNKTTLKDVETIENQKVSMNLKNQSKIESNYEIDSLETDKLIEFSTKEMESMLEEYTKVATPDLGFYAVHPNSLIIHGIKATKSNLDDISTQSSRQILKTGYSNTQTKEYDSLKLFSYILTEKTTEAELIQIKQKAEACGMAFSYKVKIKRGYIKMLQISIYLTNAKGESSKSQYYCKGSAKAKFIYEIKWNVDTNSKAVNFDGNGCTVKANADGVINYKPNQYVFLKRKNQLNLSIIMSIMSSPAGK